MILEEFVEIIGNSKNLRHYRERGYEINVGDKIRVSVFDLTNGSTFKVLICCDSCRLEKRLEWSSYRKYTTLDKDGRYYCLSCSGEKRIKTNLIKYGGKSPTCSKEIVDKIKKTNLIKYGNASSLHGSNQEKTESIFLEKYGKKSPLESEEIKEKIRNTNLERWGNQVPIKSEEVINKLKETNLEKWGVENVSKNPKIINRIREKFFGKYGKYYTQTEEFKKKSRETNFKKWGEGGYLKSNFFNKKVIDNRLSNYPNLNIIGYENSIFKIKCLDCGGDFMIKTDTLYKRNKSKLGICTICNPIGSVFRSSGEIEICQFLDDIGIKYRCSVRSIIKGEIDIFIEESNLAIEFNGIFWHSEYFKGRKYHIDKYKMCLQKGINLIQIWEDDWRIRKDILKSMILNRIKKSPHKLGARKCEIEIIGKVDSDSFLEDNHIQGKSKSSINIALKFNGEIVSLMTFGRRRINSKEELELVRFCNKKYYNVVGSASKILNYFKLNYGPKRIVSYSDNSFSNGDLYKTLGFQSSNETINYYWCDGKLKYHRFKFNKKRLISEGHDRNKTENEIMHDLGYYRIFGAGIKAWVMEIS